MPRAKTQPAAPAPAPPPPAPTAAASKPGIISTIKELMGRPTGATKSEIHAELVRRFADRDPEGMSATINTQTSRLSTNKVKDPNRGLIYYIAA